MQRGKETMPTKDPQRRKELQDDWRRRRSTPAYNRWLYDRRQLHAEVAAIHEQVLLLIARTTAANNAAALAEESLKVAQKRREEVGNRFDHQNQKPYYKEGKESA
jgi:hypothetical protein